MNYAKNFETFIKDYKLPLVILLNVYDSLTWEGKILTCSGIYLFIYLISFPSFYSLPLIYKPEASITILPFGEIGYPFPKMFSKMEVGELY